MITALILYAIPKIPLSVTTILAMLAMPAAGIVSYDDALSGFSNSATFLVAGMMIVGHAFFTSGLATQIGNLLYRFIGTNEKLFIMMILLIASALGIFLNGSLVVAMLMPIIDCIVVQSKGAITRKHTYFPLGLASVLGNNLTTVSATSMITAAGLVSAAGYGEMSLFAPTLINLPALIIVIVLYMLFGYRLQQKWFDFKEFPIYGECQKKQETPNKWKMFLTVVVLVAMIIAMISNINYGACAMAGAAILIFTHCIDERSAFAAISWPTIIIVAGAIGFSKGLAESGAGEVIANFMISICGPLGESPFAMCIILFLLGSLLSNLMSDNASVAILVPIALMLSKALACSAMPLVLATASGIKVAVCTPISVAPMTMVQIPGYRFKDYFRVGGLVNLIAMIATCFAIKLIYFQ